MLRFLQRLITRSSGNWHAMFNRALDDASTGGSKLDNPMASPWVFSGIQKIISQILAAPLVFKTSPRGGDLVEDAERAEFWNAPAIGADGRMTWEELVEITLSWVLLRGQAFWILDDDFLSPRGGGALTIARPERMRAHVVRGEMLSWQWTDGAGEVHTLLPEQVIRPRIASPFSDLQGLSPFEAARIAAEGDHAAARFAKSLMESNGDRGAYVIAENVTDEQREQIERSLKEKRALNKRGIFALSFLTGGVKVEDPKIQSADASFLATRQMNRHEIYAALGLPMSMAEVTASYSIGSASDRFRLLEETCIPLGARLCSAITEAERRRSKERIVACLDWSQHSTMKQVRVEAMEKAAAMNARGVPWRNLNDMLGLGLSEFPGWSESWLPMSLQAVSAPDVDGADDEADEANDLDELKSLLALRSAAKADAKADSAKDSAKADRLALWKRHMAARAPSEKLFRTQFSKVLAAARKETLKRLDSTKSLARQRGILDIIFDLSDFTLRLWDAMKGAHVSALEDAAEQLTLELALDDPWRVPDPLALEFLRSRENKIKDAAGEVHADIKAAIEEGLNNHESIAQISERVRGAFNTADKERGEMIATTETGAAFGTARDAGLKASGIEEKEWLSAQDDRVRLSHAEADGQHVPVFETFTVDGESLDHPCDPKGSAKNVINCRCVLIAHVP